LKNQWVGGEGLFRTVISHWSLAKESSGSVRHMGSEKSLLELSMVNGDTVVKDVYYYQARE